MEFDDCDCEEDEDEEEEEGLEAGIVIEFGEALVCSLADEVLEPLELFSSTLVPPICCCS